LLAVSSARVTHHMRGLRAAWQPYRADDQVAEADRLLTGLLR
jgi:hypothetical protein